jgi:hypothetical protein
MRCKNCKVKFEPKYFNQKFCLENDECIKSHVEYSRVKAWKDKKKKMKESLQTKSDYVKILQILVNKYVKIRDNGKPCISCQKEITGKTDAGHYYSVGNYPSVRFDLRNIHSQCINCNQFNGGNLIEYRKHLITKIGQNEFDDLDRLAHQNRQFTIDEIKDEIKKYKQWMKEIS